MAHVRDRHILPILGKRLKLWPILGLIGPRQVGGYNSFHGAKAVSLKTILVRITLKIFGL